MPEFTLRKRLLGFLGLLMFLLFGLGSAYFAYDELSELFSYPSTITVVTGTVFIILAPLFFIPVALLFIHPVFFGRQASLQFQKKLFIVPLCIFFAWIPIELLCRFIYINHIESIGYVPCRGIPTGYTPGRAGAIRYALTQELCDKKNR